MKQGSRLPLVFNSRAFFPSHLIPEHNNEHGENGADDADENTTE